MIPGMNPRKMQQMMKQMGIQQQDIPATRVEIFQEDKKIVIENPQVAKVNMMGQQTWQIVGPAREERISTAIEVTSEDVQTVAEQAGVSEEEARTAIEAAKGDLAEAIMKLQE